MAEQCVTFKFEGLALAGVVRLFDSVSAAEPRPAFIVLHGFGSNMNAGNVRTPCTLLGELGYVTLRFDMPGCGDSEGEKGRLICLEQVGAVSEALTMLAQHPQVNSARIAVLGSSFGAAVAVYAGGVDQRIAAIDPFDADAHRELGRLSMQRNEPDAAAREFRAVLALAPVDQAAAHTDLAESYFKSGKPAGRPKTVSGIWAAVLAA